MTGTIAVVKGILSIKAEAIPDTQIIKVTAAFYLFIFFVKSLKLFYY